MCDVPPRAQGQMLSSSHYVIFTDTQHSNAYAAHSFLYSGFVKMRIHCPSWPAVAPSGICIRASMYPVS